MPPSLVEQRVIDRYPAGTPQRTVLEWFRAVQESRFDQAAAFYAPQVGISSATILFDRTADSHYFALAQPPRIIGASVGATRATLFTVIDFRWSAPDGRGFLYRRPQAFELRRSQGQWQLMDNFFLDSARLLVPTGPCATC